MCFLSATADSIMHTIASSFPCALRFKDTPIAQHPSTLQKIVNRMTFTAKTFCLTCSYFFISWTFSSLFIAVKILDLNIYGHTSLYYSKRGCTKPSKLGNDFLTVVYMFALVEFLSVEF